MAKLFDTKNQKILFGLIVDPIVFLLINILILYIGISIINWVPPLTALLHTILGFIIVYVLRFAFKVYNQNWKKFPIVGVARIAVSEIIALFVHYAVQMTFPMNHISMIHLISISTIDLISIIGLRMCYYAYFHKKEGHSKLLLSSPTMHDDEQVFIQEAFEKNWVAPLGFNCDGFENEMVEKLGGSMSAFATVSGTSAIHLAVKLAGVKPGDIVFCTDLTFSATVNPVIYEGGKPVFIDSEHDTWNMDPYALEKAFEKYPECKVVVLAHLYGTPAKVDEILEVCQKHNAVLIEDAAEALGATYKNQSCGTFGQYDILSFNGNKIITTSGGGMLLTKDKESRDKAMFWSTQSREPAPWYQHKEIGYNYRMSNIVAGIGRGQLKHLDEHMKLKEQIYFNYKNGFIGTKVSSNPYLEEDSHPNFWLSCLIIDKDFLCKCTRSDLDTSWVHENGKSCPDEIAQVLRENQIETRPIWKPMHMQPFYKDNDFIYIANEPVSEDIFARGLCLPSDIKMSKEQQNEVIRIVKDCFNK